MLEPIFGRVPARDLDRGAAVEAGVVERHRRPGVAEDALDGVQRGAAADRLGGVRVADPVRREDDVGAERRRLDPALVVPDRVREEEIGAAGAGERAEEACEAARERDDAGAAALAAADGDGAPARVDVGVPNADGLAEAGSGGEEEADEGRRVAGEEPEGAGGG